MRFVKPILVNSGNLTSSTIPEPDAADGEIEWTAGSYNTGDRRIKSSTHRIYQVVATPSTTDDPEVGVNAVPPTWNDVGATNRYRMFDAIVGTQSVETSSPLIVELTPSQLFNAVAVFGISGAGSINVTVNDPIDGEVYNTDVRIVDNSAVYDYYEYFFSPIIRIDQFALMDLPAYPQATLTLTATNSGGDISIGDFVFGAQTILGTALYGTNWQLLDFSKKERDTFGNFEIVAGRTSDLFNYDVSIQKSKFNYVRQKLKEISTTPVVWAGTDEVDDGTLVYGYYKDAQINISSPSILQCTIQVEGLI